MSATTPSRLGTALLVVLCSSRPGLGAPSVPVFEDQGAPARGLLLVATDPRQKDRVVVATGREVFQRRGRAPWRRLAAVPGRDAAQQGAPRVLALGISRQGILVGLSEGLWVLGARRGGEAQRVPLARLPVAALAVSRDGRRTWVGQGRWLWVGQGRRWQRVGRCPGGPWRALAAHPTLRGVVTGSDGRRVFRSADGGRSWSALRIQAGGAQVMDIAYSLRARRGVSLLVLTRRRLIELRRGRAVSRPGPLSPARLLGASLRSGADWVLGAALFGATGPRGAYRPRSLGLRGGAVRSLASDWRDPAGLWCVTGAGVFRLRRRALRLRAAARCRLDAAPAGLRSAWRRAHWAPRLTLGFVADRPRRAELHRSVGHRLGLGSRWQWKVLVSLRWPMELGTAEVTAQQRLITSARWRRLERWRQRGLAHCRQAAVSPQPGSELWFEGEIIRALLGRAALDKE